MSVATRFVVGVDGREGGERALIWAAREADERGGELRMVIAWQWDGAASLPVPPLGDERRRAEEVLVTALDTVVRRHPRLRVSAEAIEGRAADVLVEAAAEADLLVLGGSGHGRLRHVVLGSVTEQCLRLSPRPVVVVPASRAELAAAVAPREPECG